jgi:hypothetical protein
LTTFRSWRRPFGPRARTCRPVWLRISCHLALGVFMSPSLSHGAWGTRCCAPRGLWEPSQSRLPASSRSQAPRVPSNLAIIRRYVLTPGIFDILRNQSAGAGGEIQLADAINVQAARGDVGAVPLNGRRFDCGSVEGYLDAITHVADRRCSPRT